MLRNIDSRHRLHRHPRRIREAGESCAFPALVDALRRGEPVFDRVFDDVFPLEARRASSVHWTPVDVAVRAARLLTQGVAAPVVLDVGSGIGKFCTIAAATVNATILGVEHRRHFVEIARAAASKLGVAVDFAHGTIDDHDLSAVNGVYMFNPFAENLATKGDHLDETVELNESVYWRDIASVVRFLERAQLDTRVVTYCGFGGKMPSDYELVLREAAAGKLELWRKTSRAAA